MLLAGLRVLDFCWVGAGAFVTRILADLGAEVIKIESQAHPDNLRLSGPHAKGARPLESSGYFASRNTSKKSMALNMSLPEAREIALKLAKICGVVTNNFRPGIMERWGLGYKQVAELNPSVIYLGMPMQGASGPHSNYIGFGSTIAALCGLVNMAGLPGRTPLGTGTHYPDHVPNPGHALVAMLAALYHRSRTGEGQQIEIAQIESTINIIGSYVLQYSANSTLPALTGNRRPGVVPCGVFPCAGEDNWCTVEITSDEQWRRLRLALGHPAWMHEPELKSVVGRMKREDYIERTLGKETIRYEAHQLMSLLQSNGIPASIVNTNADVLSDPQLAHREYWRRVPHPEMGELLINAPPFRVVGEPRQDLGPPPLLGEHTMEIATTVLGFDTAECKRLVEQKVFF